MHTVPTSPLHTRTQDGFTLIEVLITVAIVAVLAAVALPAYGSYITKSKVKAGQADLMALVGNMESVYQKTLAYPAATTTTADTKAAFTGWAPAQDKDFKYIIQSVSGLNYSLQAIGISSALTNCTITVTQDNTRSISSGCGASTW